MPISTTALAVTTVVSLTVSYIMYSFNQWAIKQREDPNAIEWVTESFQKLREHSKRLNKELKRKQNENKD
jgi:hypothetical protein